MKPAVIVEALTLLGIEPPKFQPRSGWVISRCPLGPWNHEAGESSPGVFGVRIDPGDPFAYCFACGFHGEMSGLVLAMQQANRKYKAGDYPFGQVMQLIAKAEEEEPSIDLDTPDLEEVLFGKTTEMVEFQDWWLGSFPAAYDVPFAAEYLSGRGVSSDLAVELDLRADPTEKRVCFPVRDFGGVCRGLHGRAVDQTIEPRYRMYTFQKKNNPIVWLGEHHVDRTRPIVVVEGPFDYASTYRVYRNVVSPLFANPSEVKLRRMADALEWVTLLDRGTGGDKGRERITTALKDHVVTHLLPPTGRKDPGESLPEELATVLGTTVKLDEIFASSG